MSAIKNSGKLFVIEGVDGSGKSTQFEMLCTALKETGKDFRSVRFPRYNQRSAALLEMYLEGSFGTSPTDVNPYAASTFYAVDRYASFKTDWGQHYKNGVPIICDRYTTSNAVHQASKLPEQQLKGFLDWLFDYEYNLLELPKPSMVFFLDMPTELSLMLIEKRQGQSGDIHERDSDYLALCRQRALSVCEHEGWKIISCTDQEGALKTAQQIHEEILFEFYKKMEE